MFSFTFVSLCECVCFYFLYPFQWQFTNWFLLFSSTIHIWLVLLYLMRGVWVCVFVWLVYFFRVIVIVRLMVFYFTSLTAIFSHFKSIAEWLKNIWLSLYLFYLNMVAYISFDNYVHLYMWSSIITHSYYNYSEESKIKA